MPRYYSPSGKTFFSETDIPEDELESVFDELDADPEDEVVVEPEPMAAAPPVEVPPQTIGGIPMQADIPEPPQSIFGKGWDLINEPLIKAPQGVRDSIEGMDAPTLDATPDDAWWKGLRGGMASGATDVLESLTSPVNLATALLSGGSSIAARAGSGALARGLSTAARAPSLATAAHGAIETFGEDKTLPQRAMGIAEMFGGYAGMKANPGGIPKPKPVVVGASIVDSPEFKAANQLLIQNGFDYRSIGLDPADVLTFAQQFKNVPIAPIPKPAGGVSLPADLSGAKPRYNIGSKSYEPQFENDIDKALFIISQSKPSRRDADYLKYVMEQTGLDEGKARQLGQQIRNQMKGHLAGQEVGPVTLPKLYNPPPAPTKVKPKIKMIGGQPDMNDPVTAAYVKQAQSNKPVPQAQRISPDETVEIPEVVEQVVNPDGSMADVLKKEPTALQNFLGLPRALQSTYDLSFPFRQGLGLIHTKGWWTSWGKMLKSFGSEASYQGLMDSISERPNFKPRTVMKNGVPVKGKSLAEEAGLAVTDLKNMREEELSSSWAEKVPFVRGSNRAYNAFANKLRADNFDTLVQQAKDLGLDPENNLPVAKEIANFINNASGRGDLHFDSLKKSADALNNIFFSPRLMASRLQMMNPANYVMGTPMMRRQYLKSIMATATAWTTMATMAKMAGAEVSLDPTNSDFGKIKIGDTRLDPAGGFQQYLVLGARIARGEFTSSTTGKTQGYGERYGSPTRLDALKEFITNKLAPVPSYGARFLNASSRRPFFAGEETAKMFIPIMMQDIIELSQENPAAMGLAIPSNLVGVGSNTYGKSGQGARLIPESWDLRIPAKKRY